jgi:hypothetical protein
VSTLEQRRRHSIVGCSDASRRVLSTAQFSICCGICFLDAPANSYLVAQLISYFCPLSPPGPLQSSPRPSKLRKWTALETEGLPMHYAGTPALVLFDRKTPLVAFLNNRNKGLSNETDSVASLCVHVLVM